MDILGGKWRLSIICLLKNGKSMRYNQIKRGIPGITSVMLSQSLKSLEEYRIISRHQFNEVPVRVEYQITEEGLKLILILEMLREWSNAYMCCYPNKMSHCTNCLMEDGL